MNYNSDFKEWLTGVRFSRKVCMLIPMEACMGLPIAIRPGEEYLLPFFGVASGERTDTLLPPFAYLRISYPSAAILTYNSLRTLPAWRNMDWSATVERNETGGTSAKLEDYYSAISAQQFPAQTTGQPDELLMDSLNALSSNRTNSLLAVWYRKLIAEAEKYR